MRKNKDYFAIIIKFFDKYPREYYLVSLFIFGALIIIYSVFSYTVINYDFYQKLADKQQLGKIILPVNRGTIYASTNSSQTTLATSLSLNDLAIDPEVKGDKTRLSIFLKDIVYKQICQGKKSTDCYNNMLKFLHVLEIPDFKLEETYIKNLILQEIQKKLSKTKVTNVVLGEALEQEKINKITNLRLRGVYVNGLNVYANPEEISDLDTTVLQLKPYLTYDKQELTNLLKKRNIRYISIINKLNILLSDEIKQYILDELDAIKKGILDTKDSIEGFIILSGTPSRYYPEKTLAGSVVGFLDQDGIGHYGVEGYFNEQLKGNNGKIYARKDILGRTIDSLNLDKNELITAGVDITLTIDRNIQKKVEDTIEEGVKKFKANKGSIIVMDPKTGDILAMANYPGYDLNSPSDVYDLEKVTGAKYPNPGTDLLGKVVLVEDNLEGKEFYYDGQRLKLRIATREEVADPVLVKYKYKNDFGAGVYQNDTISGLYEPGSIMKAITVAVGLDAGEINRYDMYQDNMELTIDNFTIRNVGKQCEGYKSFNNALIYSCNVGMIRIVQRIGKSLLYNYLDNFGFGKPTGITLDGEVFSVLPNYEKWSKAQMYTISYGLGISVTPLQMASAYSVLANGGVYVKPNIIKSIKMPSGKSVSFKPEITHRVIKESTAKIITSMLVDSVDNGFASNGKVEGYNMAGKTGTAQIAFRGGYEDGVGSTVGSFAGYGPAEDPKFVIIMKMDRPRTTAFGGESSAYMFSEISKYLLDYYGIPKTDKK
ncbi:MAG: penicillin-binding protein 2 [Candidatus Gracilibacteria bacterium]|nr:penicillin-binding protein 2 [Candidatus Gracilibacteria bacterium]